MFDPKSDYALNKKDPSAIIYIDAFGTLSRITPADFSDPEEFQRWKAWSDESYRQIENAGIAFHKHTLSLHGLSEMTIAVKSPEDTLIGRSAGIRTPGLLVPNIGQKIQSALSNAFGAVCPGNSCFPGLSPSMVPCVPGVVWVGVWVRARMKCECLEDFFFQVAHPEFAPLKQRLTIKSQGEI